MREYRSRALTNNNFCGEICSHSGLGRLETETIALPSKRWERTDAFRTKAEHHPAVAALVAVQDLGAT